MTLIAPIQGVVTKARHELRESLDTAAIVDTGIVRTFDDGGDTELIYKDDKDRTTQITKDGALNVPAATFLNLTDTPGAYAGAGSQLVRVNAGATALEFVSGVAIDPTAFHDGGDSFGADAVVGTNDAFDFSLEVGGVDVVKLERPGAGVGTFLYNLSGSPTQIRSFDFASWRMNSSARNTMSFRNQLATSRTILSMESTSLGTGGLSIQNASFVSSGIFEQNALAVFADGSLASLNVGTSGAIPMQMFTDSTLRATLLAGANTLQGNSGFTLEGGAGVDTLTLSGGASPASLIQIGIASEKIGLYGVTAVVRPGGWTITNDAADRTFDANATSVDELADVVATLIRDMAALGATGAVA